jgi:hypothetical protein
MRRLPATSALIALTCLLLAAPTLGSGGPPPQSAAVVTLVTCHTGTSATDRYAVFRAQQKTTFPGDQMSLRFDLYRRTRSGSSFRAVRPPAGFGVWYTARRGIARFHKSVRATRLALGDDYRVFVMYHWQDPRFSGPRRTRRGSDVCRQPVLRTSNR